MSSKRQIRSITICSSASFYKQVLIIGTELEKLGFKANLPHHARVMKRTGDYKVSSYKAWLRDPKDFKRKAWLMRQHFAAVKRADAILVVNLRKRRNYGNVANHIILNGKFWPIDSLFAIAKSESMM